MRFKEYINRVISGEFDPKTKEQLAFDYAIDLGFPCVCSISTAVFTHGDLVFDPTVGSNLGFYADAQGILNIAPHIANRYRQKTNVYWFDRNINPLPVIETARVSCVLFSLNPYRYSGQTFHLLGIKTNNDGNFEIWDTAVWERYEVLDER